MFIPLYLLIIGINTILGSDKVIYTFTEFPYKETNKNVCSQHIIYKIVTTNNIAGGNV